MFSPEVPENEAPPFPKSSISIVICIACIGFAAYGTRAVLVLYLNNVLRFSETSSMIIYHVFNLLMSLFSIVGTLVADGWLGEFSTSLFSSIFLTVGLAGLSVAPIAGILGLSQVALAMVSLVIFALGMGGVLPCLNTLGGAQFQSAHQTDGFFALMYFALCLGGLMGMYLLPLLREQVHCFGSSSCYPLAIASATLVALSIACVLLVGSRWLTKRSTDSAIVEKLKCIWHAMTSRRRGEQLTHWLDKADDRFDSKLIQDVKDMLKPFVIYVSAPIFWALYEQTGSSWTLQAVRMNGDVGYGISIMPDQIQVVNPVLDLVFIPLFSAVLYPALAKYDLLQCPLQKLTLGCIFAALSFLIAAVVEFAIEGAKTKSLSILWLVPQFAVITAAEIFYVVATMQFLFAEAPSSMKSLIMSATYVPIGCGDLIVVLVTQLGMPQLYHFLLYAGLMFLSVLLFVYYTKNYEYKHDSDRDSEKVIS